MSYPYQQYQPAGPAAGPPYQPAAYGGYAEPAYNPAPYNPGPAAYGPPGGYGGGDEIRTIFVTGFPEDTHERELINMCRFLPDYEAASMKMKGSVVQGFILFRNRGGAEHAMVLLNGVEFDNGFVLRCEVARKNMFLKSGDYERPGKAPRTFDGGPSAGGYGGPPSGGGPVGGPGPGGPGGAFVDRNLENPPNDTLFIGNLGHAVTDEELNTFFRNLQPTGFKQLKTVRNVKGVTCFAQFTDQAVAQEVHDSTQGATIDTNDRGPIRIQFSKNALGEFGKRKREEQAMGYGGGGYGGGGGGGYGGGGGGGYQPAPYQQQQGGYAPPMGGPHDAYGGGQPAPYMPGQQ